MKRYELPSAHQNSLEALASDIQKAMPGFELISDCLAENTKRAAILYAQGRKFKKGKKYLLLAQKIEACCPECPCGSMACSLCQRTRRLRVMHKWLPFIESHQGAYVAVTLVFYEEMHSSARMFGWDFPSLREKVRKAVSRMGFSGPVIGGFEMDYHWYVHAPELSHWMPHFHLLVPNEPVKLRKLHEYMLRDRNLHARDEKKNRPFRKDCIDDPIRALSYCVSGIWMQHTWFRNEKGELKKRQKGHRIRSQRVFAKSLVKLNRLSDGLLTFGVNVQGIQRKIDD